MAQRSRFSATLSGIAGEYFVAAELSRRGYVASLTLRNTRGIDILASNADATKSIGIQVKSKQGRGAYWVLNKKIEVDTAENLFFVFVSLNGLESPQYYIVPKAVVARFVSVSYRAWIRTPGLDGKPHRETPMRLFRDRWILPGSLGLVGTWPWQSPRELDPSGLPQALEGDVSLNDLEDR